jgi:putative DNA methylase
MALAPFEWKDKPALIEHLFPVQKISAESYREQMAGSGKTLTALGSYWKGRKPLILNKACILGSLLPLTEDHLKDLEIFEMLMGMDAETMQRRLEAALPVSKRDSVGELLVLPYSEQVSMAKRPEEQDDHLYAHIWYYVNQHLGTCAKSFPELVEQMGIARFGRRPKVADVFSGSGQIPFEAARLGCDVYASDLNPIACMLTWGGFNIVGASKEKRAEIDKTQKELAEQVQKVIDELGVETDGNGWRGRSYLYCNEVKCPETGWMVPLMPSFVISEAYSTIVKLIPNTKKKCYEIDVITCDQEELESAKNGTIQGAEVIHSPFGTPIRFKISSVRGDFEESGEKKSKLRKWLKHDIVPLKDDVYQERLYAVQWIKIKSTGKTTEYELRKVTNEDLELEQKVIDYVSRHLEEWQEKGYIPDMVIEA